MSSAISTQESQPDDERNRLWIFGYPVSHSVAPKVFNIIFPAIGLPKHVYSTSNCKTLDDPNASWFREMKQPYALGSTLTMPLKIQAMEHVDEVDDTGKAVGSINTTYFKETPDGKRIHVGCNTDILGVHNSLLNVLLGCPSPFPENSPMAFAQSSASAFCIGGGGAALAVVYALGKMSMSRIYLINREKEEIKKVIKQYPHLDLVHVQSTAQMQEILNDSSLPPIVLGVGAIPSYEPQTQEEKTVYEISQIVFQSNYGIPAKKLPKDSIAFPKQRVFLEMAYKPPMTILRKTAEDAGWKTINGMEAVYEVCFEQTVLFTGKVPSLEVREKARKRLRADA